MRRADPYSDNYHATTPFFPITPNADTLELAETDRDSALEIPERSVSYRKHGRSEKCKAFPVEPLGLFPDMEYLR